jgi:hypothetical protein
MVMESSLVFGILLFAHRLFALLVRYLLRFAGPR